MAPRSDASASPGTSFEARARALEEKLSATAKASGGNVSVTVIHLPSGARASVNGDKRMPMMSVFKLPLALVALDDVDAGRRHLSDAIAISEAEIRPNVSPIAEAWAKGEKSPTLERILLTVIQDSDNTSGDKLVTLLGGGAAITARLRAMGLTGIDVVEQEIEIAGRLQCPGVASPPAGWSPSAIHSCADPGAPAKLAAARHEMETSPNAATTDALAAMLVKLARGEILSPMSRAWITATLDGTHTGAGRLKAGLPPQTRFGHKTGTGDTIEGLNVATNDIGIVNLIGGGQLAIAVLTSGLPGDDAARDRVIADIGREAYDAFSH